MRHVLDGDVAPRSRERLPFAYCAREDVVPHGLDPEDCSLLGSCDGTPACKAARDDPAMTGRVVAELGSYA